VSRPSDVPRLPRGRGLRVTGPMLFRIAMVAALLAAVILLRRPCADAVSELVTGFDETALDAAPAPRDPAEVEVDPYRGGYIEITPGMTDAEIEAAIERARGGSAP
jgi:hypothetical protein